MWQYFQSLKNWHESLTRWSEYLNKVDANFLDKHKNDCDRIRDEI